MKNVQNKLKTKSIPQMVRTNNHQIHVHMYISSVQFSSVAQSCQTLCDPMNRSTPGLPVHHKFPEFTETHVHRLSDFWAPKSLQMVTAAMKLKATCSLEEKL